MVAPSKIIPDSITARLLQWYGEMARTLPWRATAGQAPDPYRVWVSEIMLQQTTVAAVIPYFNAFTSRWPTVQALAAAPLEDVLHQWQGLGYYSRARNLHQCAKTIVIQYNGQFPNSAAALQNLPGIGPYTAGAVASIAFGEPVAAVDGNVNRVISRLHALPDPPAKMRDKIHSIVQSLVPHERTGDFTQALMELGATVCTPRKPMCLVCPLQQDCRAFASGQPTNWPVPEAKRPVPTRSGHLWAIHNPAGALWMRQRPERGLLGGMMEIPSTDWVDDLPAFTPPFPSNWQRLPGVVQHTFTHFHLELTVWETTCAAGPPLAGRWVMPGQREALALPTVMKKAIRHIDNTHGRG